MRNMRVVDNLPHVGESNNDKIKVDERVVLNTKDRVISFLCIRVNYPFHEGGGEGREPV